MTYLSFTQLLYLNVAGKFDSFAQSLNFLRQNRDNNSIHAPIKAKTMPTLFFFNHELNFSIQRINVK